MALCWPALLDAEIRRQGPAGREANQLSHGRVEFIDGENRGLAVNKALFKHVKLTGKVVSEEH